MAFRLRRPVGRTLYLTESGARLDAKSGHIEVASDDGTQKLPVHLFDSVVCLNIATITTRAIQTLCEHGKSISLLSHRGQRFVAIVDSLGKSNAPLRHAQHLLTEDESGRLDVAKTIVAAKLRTSRNWIRRLGRTAAFAGDTKTLDIAADMQSAMLRRVAGARGLDEVRGAEGSAAQAHFSALSKRIASVKGFEFVKRVRRPPTDPVNAMLSFGYTLLASDCLSAVQAAGLDPGIGFLHDLRAGRPALALDLMEEFRCALVDRLVVRLLSLRQLKPSDFDTEMPARTVTMSKTGRKRFLHAYAKQRTVEVKHPFHATEVPTYLLPHIQARLLARHVRGDLSDYPPWVLK